MGEWLLLGWMAAIWIVLLNGFAAGVAAVQHIWGRHRPLRVRILIAVGFSGLLPAGIVCVAAMDGAWSSEAESMAAIIIASVMMLLANGVLALPGAVVIARRLDRASVDTSAFR